MGLKDQTTLRVVLYEGNGAQPLEISDRFAAMTALLERFRRDARRGEGRVAPADRGSLLVLGVLTADAPRGKDTDGQVSVRFQDIGGFDANRVAETVESVRAETNAAKHGDWKRGSRSLTTTAARTACSA